MYHEIQLFAKMESKIISKTYKNLSYYIWFGRSAYLVIWNVAQLLLDQFKPPPVVVIEMIVDKPTTGRGQVGGTSC